MLTVAIMIAGWIAMYLVLRRMLQRNMTQMASRFQKDIEALHATGAGSQQREEMTPEAISELGRSLSDFIGAEVRVHSVKKLPVSNPVTSPWAREGCVLVQNSHQLEPSRPKLRVAAKPIAVGAFKEEAGRRAA